MFNMKLTEVVQNMQVTVMFMDVDAEGQPSSLYYGGLFESS
jgi:hypothetical protein